MAALSKNIAQPEYGGMTKHYYVIVYKWNS